MGQAVLMPKLGMTMESGRINKWLVKEGDQVSKGDPLLEVETDKVALEVESLVEGTVLKIFGQEGETLPINQPIAYVGAPGETIPAELFSSGPSATEIPAELINSGPSATEIPAEEQPKQGEDLINNGALNFDTDLVVIGGGPGGYVAAIRAAQLGAKVMLVEKDNLGGTCLNFGCIPTKALLRNAEIWAYLQEAEKMGISVKGASFDWKKMIERKDEIVRKLGGGIHTLLQRNNVEFLNGVADVVDNNTVSVKLNDGDTKVITTKYIILATGTVPMKLEVDSAPDIRIHDTNSIFGLEKLPKSIAIIGGGVVGAEFASIFNALGVKVTIIELLPAILSMMDEDVSALITKEFTKKGINLLAGVKVRDIKKSNNLYKVLFENGNEIEAEEVLMAVGRKVEEGAFSQLAVKRDQRGFIETNNRMQTSIENIYAIGDITGKMQLAHVASAQGIIAAENIFGEGGSMEYDVIPNCIFTFPQVAAVGLTEKQAKEKQVPYEAVKFPFSVNGKSLTLGNTDGFIKIISDSRWGEILGVHIVGPEASSLIHEAVIAMKLEGTALDIATAVHAHPTLAEGMMEAAAKSLKRSIHF